ncbi:uncharacterized protein LOC144428028 [Styela clava]
MSCDFLDVLEQLRKSVKAKEFKGWYQASNGFYYKLFNDRVNNATAKSNCQKQGSDLASAGFRNPTVLSELMSLITAGNEHTWVGLSKHEGKFIWADGEVSTEDNTDGMQNSQVIREVMKIVYIFGLI